MNDAGIILTTLLERPAGLGRTRLRRESRLSFARIAPALDHLITTGQVIHVYQRYVHHQHAPTFLQHHATLILGVLSSTPQAFRAVCKAGQVDAQIASPALALLKERGDAERHVIQGTTYWTTTRPPTVLVTNEALQTVLTLLKKGAMGAAHPSVTRAGLTRDAFIQAAAILTERGEVDTSWSSSSTGTYTHTYATYRLATRIILPTALPKAAPQGGPRVAHLPRRAPMPAQVAPARPATCQRPRQPIVLRPQPSVASSARPTRRVTFDATTSAGATMLLRLGEPTQVAGHTPISNGKLMPARFKTPAPPARPAPTAHHGTVSPAALSGPIRHTLSAGPPSAHDHATRPLAFALPGTTTPASTQPGSAPPPLPFTPPDRHTASPYLTPPTARAA